MRKPVEDPYAWHRRALAGIKQEIDGETPSSGWFQRRLVKDGPMVPVRITVIQEIGDDGELLGPLVFEALEDGKPVKARDIWTWVADQPISEQDYEFMMAKIAYAKVHMPNAPEANPRRAVRRKDIPPLF